MGRYDGKRVVITGGASGMGLATAQLLVAEGARVMVTAHNQASLVQARTKVPDVLGVVSDTTSRADNAALVEHVKSDLETLDALVVAAGQTRFVPFDQVTEDTYDQLFAVNAKGAYFTVQSLAPLIAAGGAVVLITSVSDVLGQPGTSVYAASKAALRSMTRSLARELLPNDIRVNAVSPGPIDTGILEKALPEDAAKKTRQQMIDRNPMKRFGRPEEVARAIAFLAFDATYTNAFELVVDGGSTQM